MKVLLRKIADIEYTLYIKSVKNINLRIDRTGNVKVSANGYVPINYVDEFVLSKREWIKAAVLRSRDSNIPTVEADDDEVKKFFEMLSERAYQIFKNEISFKPEIKIKNMKSAWGICHPKKRYITFNKALYFKPLKAAEYVFVHEYAHFLYPDHGKNFYAKISSVMPDYKERKKLLKG